MTDEQNQGGFQKPMYDVDEKCAQCEAPITKLPFQPDPSRRDQLKCRDCHSKGKPAFRGDRQMHQGNWKCSSCGGAITELPFEPRPDKMDQLKCRDCFKQGR